MKCDFDTFKLQLQTVHMCCGDWDSALCAEERTFCGIFRHFSCLRARIVS